MVSSPFIIYETKESDGRRALKGTPGPCIHVSVISEICLLQDFLPRFHPSTFISTLGVLIPLLGCPALFTKLTSPMS